MAQVSPISLLQIPALSPWTDRKGNQELYKAAAEYWKEFHDSLDQCNPNKVLTAMLELVLRSQLYGHAADLFTEL